MQPASPSHILVLTSAPVNGSAPAGCSDLITLAQPLQSAAAKEDFRREESLQRDTLAKPRYVGDSAASFSREFDDDEPWDDGSTRIDEEQATVRHGTGEGALWRKR